MDWRCGSAVEYLLYKYKTLSWNLAPTKKKKKKKKLSKGYTSMVEYLPSMLQALSLPSTTKNKSEVLILSDFNLTKKLR
jgi:hypothetical protein